MSSVLFSLVAHSTCWWNFREHCFQVRMIEVPCYNVYSVRICALLAANAAIQMTASRFSISVRWDVNSCYHDDSRLSREVNRPAFHSHILQVQGAVAVYSHCISTPAVIHVHTQPLSSALTGALCPVTSLCSVACYLSCRVRDKWMKPGFHDQQNGAILHGWLQSVASAHPSYWRGIWRS